MSSLPEVKNALYSHLLASWADKTPVVLDNEANNGEPEEWIRAVVIALDGAQTTLGRRGNRKYTRAGTIIVSVFTKRGEGSAQADKWAEEIRGMFEGNRVGPAWFLECEVRSVGEDGKYYQVNVDCTFNYEEMK